MTRRKHISMEAKLHAALYQLGIDPKDAHLDHSPPLALREWDDVAGDTIPPASDPKHLVWMSSAKHREKTSGRKNVTVAGSDIHVIAKVKRLNGTTPKKPAASFLSKWETIIRDGAPAQNKRKTAFPKRVGTKWPKRKFGK